MFLSHLLLNAQCILIDILFSHFQIIYFLPTLAQFCPPWKAPTYHLAMLTNSRPSRLLPLLSGTCLMLCLSLRCCDGLQVDHFPVDVLHDITLSEYATAVSAEHILIRSVPLLGTSC